jgi:ABC-type glycerol-3-phosphate transport system substrate-binding protein
MFSPDGKRCTLDSPEVIRAVQLMQDLIYKFKVTPTPVEEQVMAGQGGWGSTDINLFGAKRGAMAIGGRWWLANLRSFKGLHLRAVESPTGGVRQFSTTGRATLINASSPRREAALEFMVYLASQGYNELVNDQADGICAFKRFASGPKFLLNSEHPDERDNEVWRIASELAVPSETSPYVNGNLALRIIAQQLDLVKIKQKTAADAMSDAATQINALIQENLRGGS